MKASLIISVLGMAIMILMIPFKDQWLSSVFLLLGLGLIVVASFLDKERYLKEIDSLKKEYLSREDMNA